MANRRLTGISRGATARALIVGQLTLDIFVKFSEFPDFGRQVLGRDYQIQVGGTALNIAAALGCLGTEVALISRIGADPAGRLVQEMLIERAIAINHLIIDETEPTSLSIINIGANGEIGIVHHEGAIRKISLGDIPVSEIHSFDVVHVGGAMLLPGLDGSPLADLLGQAQESRVMTALTVAKNTERKDFLSPAFPFLDLLFMNEKESFEISGLHDKREACRWLSRQGVRTTVVTLGGKGAYISDPDYEGVVPAFQVPVVDTTGCGDAFSAGFLDAALRGMSPLDCAIWGNAVGAHCARTSGAVLTPFERSELVKMVESFDGNQNDLSTLSMPGGIESSTPKAKPS